MKNSNSKCLIAPLVFTVSISVVTLFGVFVAIRWLYDCPPDCPNTCNCLTIITGIMLILLEAGLIGLAFFFAWQHFKVISFKMEMDRKEEENVRLDKEHGQLDKDAKERRDYQQKRDLVNDKFRIIEIAKKKTETDQKTEIEELPVSTKTKKTDTKKTITTEEIALEQFKPIFPDFFKENSNS
jgi:hypothetical protein